MNLALGVEWVGVSREVLRVEVDLDQRIGDRFRSALDAGGATQGTVGADLRWQASWSSFPCDSGQGSRP